MKARRELIPTSYVRIWGASLAEINDMVVTARIFGWVPGTAFVVGMQLRCAGVSAHQARWMFHDALRRTQ